MDNSHKTVVKRDEYFVIVDKEFGPVSLHKSRIACDKELKNLGPGHTVRAMYLDSEHEDPLNSVDTLSFPDQLYEIKEEDYATIKFYFSEDSSLEIEAITEDNEKLVYRSRGNIKRWIPKLAKKLGLKKVVNQKPKGFPEKVHNLLFEKLSLSFVKIKNELLGVLCVILYIGSVSILIGGAVYGICKFFGID